MKKRLGAVTVLFAMVLTMLSVPVSAASLEVAPTAAILMDAATGTVLYEKEAHMRLAPASVTKVMTLLLVMEAIDSGVLGWEDQITASAAAAAKGGSQVYLEEGEQMSVRDMVKSVVVASANDCATALAEAVSGSELAFVERMNERAAELGMADTHFVNCTGLDDDPYAAEHLTSAYDIAVMSRELLKHDEIREFTTIWMDSVRDGQFGLTNTNKLVRFYNGTTGLKTGYTSAAGHCISATAERDGMELIAVVLHASSSTERFETAKTLLDYGFANYALVSAAPETPLPAVPVELGTAPAVQTVLQETTPILVEKATAQSVEREIQVQESVLAPVEAGQTLGSILLKSGETVLAEVPLVAAAEVERLSWWQLTCQYLQAVCGG
jgi:D-alanyl-D-alanine carboxypeptidase (penicillin-binding protein 5/6)